MGVQPVLVGRDTEREALRSVVERAVCGEPGMILLHGEAGIGKTSLVREAAGVAREDGCHVLFGQCLRFGANVTSFVPFTHAFSQWLRTATSESRDRLAPHGNLDDLVPALKEPSGGLALLQIGTAVDDLQADGPTVLVVDDLQWSDPSSLDALSYLVAGFVAGQRLAILATYRDTDLDEGHRLRGWLADALRMPSVSAVALGRMDAWTMEEMVLARGGPGAVHDLARKVLRRSGGNPYLADLLIGEARSAGEGQPLGEERLVDALSASWHRLSAHGRRVTQLLAVAGAPVAYQVLRELATLHGVVPEDTSRALAEAAAQGITIDTESGAIWFRHPLLAETIARSMRTQERVDLHSDLAARWHAAVGVDERDRANFLALHYVEAGDSDQAFAWSLHAADEAAAIRARDEEAIHLSTAVRLLEKVSVEAASTVDDVSLLIRSGRACESAGDDQGAVKLYETALARVERSTRDPLLASRILLELHVLRDRAGYGSTPYLSTDEPRQVPNSPKPFPTARNEHSPSLTSLLRKPSAASREHVSTRRKQCGSRSWSTPRRPSSGLWAPGPKPGGEPMQVSQTRNARSPWRRTRTTPSSAAGRQYSSATAWSRRDGTPRRPRSPVAPTAPFVTQASSSTPHPWARSRHAGTSPLVAGTRPDRWFENC